MRNAFVVTRGSIGTFASLIGFSGLVAAVVLLLWQGSLTLPVIIAFVLGVVGLIAWAALLPDDFRAFITGRGVRHGTVTIFSAVLLIGVVVMSYLLLSRAALTWDLTLGQRFSLSDTSINVLRRVSRPMQITGFYTARSVGIREIDDQFWRLYESETNGLIRRVYYDPEEVPALAEQFRVTEDPQVFLSFLNEDGSVDFSLISPIILTNEQERDMTTAISRLLIAGQLTVYFSTELGERDPLNPAADGISALNNGMRANGLITYPLDLPTIAENNGDIPADASALVFARPLRDLTSAEIAVIDRYMDRGGALLLLPDVVFNDDLFMAEAGEFNRYLWENYGLRALDTAVVDFITGQQTPLDIIASTLFDETDFAENLDPATNPVLLRLARAVDVNLEIENPDIANGRLFMSSEQSYGEIDWVTLGQTNTFEIDQNADLPGPLTLAAWSWNQRNDSRVFLIGDSDFVSNGQVLTASGNAILFTNVMNWLSHLEDEIQFGTQGFTTALPMFYTRDQLNLITFVVVFLIPGIVLVTGLGIYARRVRR